MRRLLTYAVLTVCMLTPGLALGQDGGGLSPMREAFQHMLAGDYGQTLKIVKPLAEDGDADAQHLLGYLFENGFGVPRDMQRALDLYARSALEGQADSQFALGELAFTGNGVQQDDKRAAGWYALAAAQDHPRAQVRLGIMRAQGLGVEKDAKKALALFEKAAAAGEAEAQYNLGVVYVTGDGVSRDYKQAAKWFEQSASQGHADSQFNLALIYDSDYLGAPDGEKTAHWMGAAAANGLPAAMVAMGLLIHEARIEPGSKKPADWFEDAAKAGDIQGQFLYAVSLAEGDGRAVDPEEALVWVERVLEQEAGGDPLLLDNAEALRDALTTTLNTASRQ